MGLPKRTYWSFLAALVVMAFAGGQVWSLALALRRGDAPAAQIAVGAASIPLLVISGVIVLRILSVLSGPTSKR